MDEVITQTKLEESPPIHHVGVIRPLMYIKSYESLNHLKELHDY